MPTPLISMRLSVDVASQRRAVASIVAQTKQLQHKKAVVLGESMVRETVRIIDDNFKVGDPAHRKPGVHLRNSFIYKLERVKDGTRVTLTTRPGVSAKKIAALEYGTSKSYTIQPSGVVVGFGGASRKRTSITQSIIATGFSIRDTRWLRWPTDDEGGERFARIVHRKPFAGVHFMQRGRAIAIAKMLKRQV